jgi:hypothetical protein
MSELFSRRQILFGFGAVAGGLGLPVAAGAAGDPFALQTEYVADAIFGNGRNARPGRFGRVRGAIRQEIDGGGGMHTVIVRLDQNVAWTMPPGMRLVIECDLRNLNLPVAALSGAPGGGLRKIAGDVWATDRGVIMRVVGDVAYNGHRTDLSAVFRNVRETRQDPNLFELPGGYRRVIVPLENVQQILESMSRFGAPR